jgi:hypothetical protein
MPIDLTNAQAKQFLDAAAAFGGLRQAEFEAVAYRGGMHWKTSSNGQAYLYKTKDRLGNATSLGVRSEETQRIYASFTRRKVELSQRVRQMRDSLKVHERLNSALRLGAIPNEAADVCVAIDKAGLLGKSVMVIGTNAMYAYGFLGGVRFEADIMATTDVGLLWSHKSKLSLAASDEILASEGLLGVLRRADKTYEIDAKSKFRARASSGFMVDLIRQMPHPPWADEPDRFFRGDLVATDIHNMDWLLSAPRIEQPVIAVDGRVVSLVVPDPRAFAAFKLWLSRSAERDPLKRRRDASQAAAVIELLEQRLPHLNHWGAFKFFPKQVLADIESAR